MSESIFRLVCPASALDGAPAGWAAEMLRDGEMALSVDGGGLDGVDAVAHALGQPTIAVVRREPDVEHQEQTVREYAGSLPLVWVAPGFGETSHQWARDRGPMTLLVEHDGPLPDEQRRRIERFVAILGRQAE